MKIIISKIIISKINITKGPLVIKIRCENILKLFEN